jgi:drug/metabolite transporter (DMT)-like permease
MILGILLALAQALTWSGTSILLRSLSTKLDAFLVNGLRAGIGLLVIIPLMFLTGTVSDYQKFTFLQVVYLVSSVIIGGVVGDALYVTSLKLIGVSRAFPITNTYPLFTVLFSLWLLGEQVGWTLWVGMVLVLLGVYLVARPRGQVVSSAPPLPPGQLLKGALLAVGTAILWGFGAVVLALGLRGVHGISANTFRVPVVMLLSLLAAARRGKLGELRQLRGRTLLQLLAAGILGWGVGSSLYVTAVQLAGPSKTSIVSATAPLFAVPLSSIFLHERPTRHTLLGTLLSVAGIILVIL